MMDFEGVVNSFYEMKTYRLNTVCGVDSLSNKCIYFTQQDYTKCLSLNNIINILNKKYNIRDLLEVDQVIAVHLLLNEIEKETLIQSKKIEFYRWCKV